MTEKKQHIKLEGFYSSENYKSKNNPRTPPVPLRNRHIQGSTLGGAYSQILERYQARSLVRPTPITEELGIYVELEGFEDIPLPFDNIDNRDFRLCKLTKEGSIEKALVFIPEGRRNTFQRKVTEYLDDEKLKFNNALDDYAPRNHNLIDSISTIRLADIRSFWTDSPEAFPENRQQHIWWELWLKKITEEEARSIQAGLAERLGIRFSDTTQSFFDSSVFLIYANSGQLENAVDLISNLKELRKGKEVPNPIIDSDPSEQLQWAESVVDRVSLSPDISTSVVILDGGINYDNPLIQPFCNSAYSETWKAEWDDYDLYSFGMPFQPHGSLQAGIAAYEDLLSFALSDDVLESKHVLESARILPPRGANEPKLYGDITVGTLSKLEIERPVFNRVYSLAITTEPEYLGGQPSSWSAQIDDAAFNFDDELKRLFVISTGNNREIFPSPDHWIQAELSQIEDPAQAWNAITVGAFTERTTIDEDGFEDWSPLAESGDLAPASRTSRNWGWVRQAPYKPELVAEGGNRLLSQDETEVSDADCVSILTTSGRSTGQLFETNRDSSSATALISNYAAQLMADYPELWPETIRGLLIHSASWTTKMNERYGVLRAEHTRKVARETMLRVVGYGVPNLERARYSLTNQLTLVAENSILPFTKKQGASASTDPKLNEMQLYQLPWPSDTLRHLSSEQNVKLKVTLSYFIEPNPSRRGFKKRYSYQSHGLRFEVIKPGQSIDNFKAQVNALMVDDDYDSPEGDTSGWTLGSSLRKRGSIHSDVWIGSPQDLADMQTIAVIPVGGWWKYRTGMDRWENVVRYSLLISLEAPESDIDIYSEIQTLIDNPISVEV
jgi:hypothetical protein